MKIKDEPVRAVLAEEKAEIAQSITFPLSYKAELPAATHRQPCRRYGYRTSGGANAGENYRIPIDPLIGPQDYQIRYLAKHLGYQSKASLRTLSLSFIRHSAARPLSGGDQSLASTDAGLLALDGKVTLDDKADFRQGELLKELREEQQSITGADSTPALGSEDTITYVPLTGTVGLISDGAGTGMLTLDLIKDAGGKANFCEMGGLTSLKLCTKPWKQYSPIPMLRVCW